MLMLQNGFIFFHQDRNDLSCHFNGQQFLPQEFSAGLKKLIHEWESLTRNLNVVEIVTPSHKNLKKEREKFLAAYDAKEEYNPQFTYDWLEKNDFDLKTQKKKLQTLCQEIKKFQVVDQGDQGGKITLYQCCQDSLETLKLIEGFKLKKERLIKEALNKKYSAGDDYLWLLANSYYQLAADGEDTPTTKSGNAVSEQEKKLLKQYQCDAREIASAFIWLLQKYNFLNFDNEHGYNLMISDDVDFIDVREKSTQPLTIFIPSTRKVSGEKLLRLMYHQIEGLTRQNMNCRQLCENANELRTDDETLHEGHAKRLENKFFEQNFIGDSEEKRIEASFYVLAVSLAEKGHSFYQIFSQMVDHYLHVLSQVPAKQDLDCYDEEIWLHLEEAKEKAWTVTYRIMRGHLETKNKLAFALRKDLAYMRQYLIDEVFNNLGLNELDEEIAIKTNVFPDLNNNLIKVGNLRYPFLNATKAYCLEILLPKIKGQGQVKALVCLNFFSRSLMTVKSKNNQRKVALMHRPFREIDDPYGSSESQKPESQFKIPQKESKGEDIYDFLHDELLLDGNAKQNLTTFCTTWLEPEIHKLMDDSIAKNLVDKDEYPQSAAIELRCVHMLADLWHSPEAKTTLGTSTVGSSEAAELGGLAMKWRWRQMREKAGKDTSKPNLVCGPVQICWYKFARYFDVEIRSVPLADDRLEMTAESMMPYIDENTIGVVPTLGVTYTCAYENVKEISAALDRIQTEKGWDIPIHVDAASGGFIAPFLQPDLEWDFKLPRVKSINTSGHKFGLSPLGVGWVVWREAKDLPEDLIFYVNYLGGNEATFNLNFSKPAGQVISQYYNFLRLGREGYTKIQSECAKVAKYVTDGIKKMGIFDILYDGQGALPGGCWSLKKDAKVSFNLFDITDRLRNRGWLLPSYSMPAKAENLIIQRILCRHGFGMDMADLFLSDFARTVEFLRQHGEGSSLSEAEAASFKHT